MTYPLIISFSSAIPGNGGDQYLMTWFFWEFYHYVFVLHKLPYFTNLVYYPFGVPLYVTTDMPVNSFIASIVYYFSHNILLAFNIIFLISSLLNGYFAYLLANDVLKNKTASFFAGLIFAFSPVLIEQARWGDINIWSCYGIPLYILFFNRLYKEPKAKNAVGAAAGLFLATYAGFYEFTAMLLVYSLFFIIYKFIKEDYRIRKENLKLAAKSAGISDTKLQNITNTKNKENIKDTDYTDADIRNREALKDTADNGIKNTNKKTFFYGFNLKEIKQWIKNNIYYNKIFNKKYIKSLLLMAGIFVFVSSPFLLPAIYYVYLKPGILEINPTLFWTKAYSATIVNLFIPPFFNHTLLPLTKAIYFNKFYPIIDRGMNSNNFLGYVPILFFIIGIYYYFKFKKKNKAIRGGLNNHGLDNNSLNNNLNNGNLKNNKLNFENPYNKNSNKIKNKEKDELADFKFYLTAFIFFLLMALSPLIHIVNNIRVFDPFVYILNILPVIKDVQESGRYMIIGMLFFSICAGLGIKYFLENVKSNPEILYKYNLSYYIIKAIKKKKEKSGIYSKSCNKISYGLVIAIILVFTIIGYDSSGFEMRDFKITKGIYKLKNAPYGPVLVIPFVQGGLKMYQQTIYQKPMYAGYVIRYGFHNLYKKYLPYRFYDAYGMNYKTNFNQVDIYRLGMPDYLIRNFKYLKILKVKYLLILKNRLAGYAGVYNNKNYKNGIDTGSAVNSSLTPLEIKQKSLFYINKFIKAEKGKVGVLYNGKNIIILEIK
ncbi:MAG: hypothetical protein ACYCTB_10480 [bacterium]